MPLFNSTMTPKDIVIIGAGSFGLATATSLRLAGHRVTVVAPAETTAASVAAGMIAPAMEVAIDGLSAETAAVLKRSRAMWDELAPAAGIDLQHMGAQWRGKGADALAEAMARHGFEHDLQGDVLTTHADAKLDPVAALEVMQSPIPRVYGRAVGLSPDGARWIIKTVGTELSADEVVIATGAAASINGVPANVSALIERLVPIRGIIGITRAPLVDAVVRGPGAYIAPVRAGPYAGGAVIGATMETGVRDLLPDSALCQRLLDAALAILGRNDCDFDTVWRAGIRAASSDGLPLAGPVGDGLHLALAPRRNGWLLAPLVGAQVLAGIEGHLLPEPALDPLRIA